MKKTTEKTVKKNEEYTMKDYIGNTVQKLRETKNMKPKELAENLFTPQQISNIESGSQMPSTDKFMMILEKLNVKYDEFIFFMDDDFFKAKFIMELNLAEYVKRQNIKGLRKLSEQAANLFKTYDDIFFKHTELIALAMAHLLETNHDFEGARQYLEPIKTYLTSFDEFSYYEVALISQCIFIFDIKLALKFGERALSTIKKHYTFYKNKNVGCVLLTNMATYCLDFEEYYHLSLDYAQRSMNLAATNNDATRGIHAKIVYQAACFKIENGLFDEENLFSLINTFKLLEWTKEYQTQIKFIKKHGISPSLSTE